MYLKNCKFYGKVQIMTQQHATNFPPNGLLASPALQEHIPPGVALDPAHFRANADEALRNGAWGDKRRVAVGLPGETDAQILGPAPEGVKTEVAKDVLLVRLLGDKANPHGTVVDQRNLTESVRLALMIEKQRAMGRFLLRATGVFGVPGVGLVDVVGGRPHRRCASVFHDRYHADL